MFCFSAEKDFSQICKFLKDLRPLDITKIGTSLGLKYSKLSGLVADKLPHEMVEWWLNKGDNIIEVSGTPTYKSLIKALRENGFNGHAKNIEEYGSAIEENKSLGMYASYIIT